MSCQHQSLTVERKILRADGRPRSGDENRVCAYWNADEEIMRRVREGDHIFFDKRGKPVPVGPEVGTVTPSDSYLNMGREDTVAQQLLLKSHDPVLPMRADDLGWLLAQGRGNWAQAFRRLQALGHPMAAVVATNKGRDLETVALTASTAPGMFLTWGTNPAALTAAKTDVGLFTERQTEARTSVSPTQQTTTTVNDTWQYQGTITATGTVTIAEVAVLTSSTQPGLATVASGAGVIGSSSSTALTTNATFTPGNNNYIQIRTEFMQVTAGSGSTTLTVVRMNSIAANLGGGSGSITTIVANDNIGPGNPPGQSGITGGSMLIHADHSGDGLNNGDSIQYTIKDQFT